MTTDKCNKLPHDVGQLRDVSEQDDGFIQCRAGTCCHYVNGGDAEAMDAGWFLSSKRGWICPCCVEKAMR